MSFLAVFFFFTGLFGAALLWNLSELGSRRNVQLQPVCTNCKTPLSITTWLPLYGFFSAWRCRSCQTRQPRNRFIWEIGVALYFLLLRWRWDDVRTLVFAVIASIPILLILVIDLRGNVLYLNSIVLALAVAAVLGFLDGPAGMGSAMVGLIAGVAVSIAYFALSRWVFRSMSYRVSNIGTGDIYIAAAIGALVRGSGIIPTLVFAILFTIAGNMVLPAVSKSARKRATVYGTYLCIGALITLLR